MSINSVGNSLISGFIKISYVGIVSLVALHALQAYKNRTNSNLQTLKWSLLTASALALFSPVVVFVAQIIVVLLQKALCSEPDSGATFTQLPPEQEVFHPPISELDAPIGSFFSTRDVEAVPPMEQIPELVYEQIRLGIAEGKTKLCMDNSIDPQRPTDEETIYIGLRRHTRSGERYSLDLTPFRSLTEITSKNLQHLGELKLDHLDQLESLKIHYASNITSLDLSGLESLKSLELFCPHRLTTLNLNECPNLESLKIENPISLRTLHLDRCASLKSLFVYHARELSQINFSEEAGFHQQMRRFFIQFCFRLRSLPRSVMLLPHECEVELGSNGFSTQVMNQIRDATQVEGYAGPRFRYSNPAAPSSGRSLQKAIAFVSEKAGRRLEVPTLLSNEENAENFNTWLKKLAYTGDAQHGSESFFLSIHRILKRAEADAKYRELFWVCVEEGMTTCGDRIALSVLYLELMDKVEQAVGQGNVAEVQRLLVHGFLVLDELTPIARDKVQCSSFIDPLEVYLGLPIKLKDRLGIPIDMEEMLFFVCSALTEDEITRAGDFVEARIADRDAVVEYLGKNDYWIRVLQQHAPGHVESIRENWTDNKSYHESLYDLGQSIIENRAFILDIPQAELQEPNRENHRGKFASCAIL